MVLAASACGEKPAAPPATSAPPSTSMSAPSTTSPRVATPPPSPTPVAPPPNSSTHTTTRRSPRADSGPGCGQRAVNAGRFNPKCPEYQGYLDPGGPGRGKTSGDLQREYACEQGYLPKSEC
ncbi:hypothetical protein [Amycolatopsis sp. ATCC 39116]|uniref:hypothetical protein n=1 Tax=Amycolatopsis sp. (strain ATCC 39116 / 75iv2) TaxID=385957 RepID=UPI0012F9F6D6|nr:hypothetical protein [Amycolatopsis sp. ATCC 39116]